MKKIILFIIAIAFSTISTFSQGCLPEGITFETQAQIDSFQVNYPGCVNIEGDVSIFSGYEITNLNGLSVITSISGGLSIMANYSLTSLAGLDSLTSIGGTLEIGGGYMWFGNPALTSLNGLENLSSIGGDLSLGDDDGLTNLTGLENLSIIEGTLVIFACDGLDNLTGLEKLTHIGENIYINGNYSLTSLSGLNQLDSIGGYFQLGPGYMSGGEPEAPRGNPFLTDLSGMENVTAIGGYLSICDNGSIKSLSSLENVTSIGGDLYIWQNDSLNSLSGLENIDAGSILNLYIRQNPVLSNCEVQSICDYLASPNGTIEIVYNAPGCNNKEEVEAACAVGVETPLVQSSKFKVQSYPNPTGGIVDLQFTIYNLQSISLKIYNAQGQEVAVVLDQTLPAGEHTVRWDAASLQSGIYFYRLTTDDYRLTTSSGKIVKY